ncbi:enoyl-CoA hydratase/isomerase family protein [Pseudonocardia sp. GCM10023141]|uniref:enoyl-CoA hydratase/isomerase family protein n=1 Tax=Pseudonocardia sp. GCM10023141 TaxID=3252653 RepID=UPI00360AEFEE
MTVRVEFDGAVARVAIDRPTVQNALDAVVVAGLEAAVRCAVNRGCAALVLSGTGGTLSAGADLPYLRSLLGDAAALTGYLDSIATVLDLLESAPLISIAVVGGYALAGGCEILLACDLAVVADDARIGDRHLEYGLLPGGGGSVRLPRSVPGPLARRLLYTGEMIDGATAARWGLVSHAVPAAELDATVDALAARLARHSPAALVGMKRLYRDAVSTPAAEALVAERAVLVEHLMAGGADEGLAAFAEGRAPEFRAAGKGGTHG